VDPTLLKILQSPRELAVKEPLGGQGDPGLRDRGFKQIPHRDPGLAPDRSGEGHPILLTHLTIDIFASPYSGKNVRISNMEKV
jgi:hypothetical protein